jgi:hypothetical protein
MDRSVNKPPSGAPAGSADAIRRIFSPIVGASEPRIRPARRA